MTCKRCMLCLVNPSSFQLSLSEGRVAYIIQGNFACDIFLWSVITIDVHGKTKLKQLWKTARRLEFIRLSMKNNSKQYCLAGNFWKVFIFGYFEEALLIENKFSQVEATSFTQSNFQRFAQIWSCPGLCILNSIAVW